MSEPSADTDVLSLALSPAPTAHLESRYGTLVLTLLCRAKITVHARLIINRCAHNVVAQLVRGEGEDERFRLAQGCDPPVDGDATSRRRAVEIRREGTFEASSDSARRRAAIELEHAVNEWAANLEHDELLAAADRQATACEVYRLERLVDEADAAAIAARAQRREAIEQLTGLVAENELAFSRIALPEAVRHYREFLDRELREFYALLDDGEPVSPDALAAALLPLDRLVKLDHDGHKRGENMRLWDTLQALREAPRA